MAEVPWKFVSFVSSQRRGKTLLEDLLHYISRDVEPCSNIAISMMAAGQHGLQLLQKQVRMQRSTCREAYIVVQLSFS